MTTITVYQLTDENDFEPVGRVEDGAIVAGEDALTAIERRDVWENMAPERLAARFNGPRVLATITDDGSVEDGETTDQAADMVALDDVPVSTKEMAAIAASDPAWSEAVTSAGDRAWANRETHEIVVKSATPEGVPDGYTYVPPDQQPPEDAEVTESPHGGTYTDASTDDLEPDDELGDVEVTTMSAEEMSESTTRFMDENPRMAEFMSDKDPEDLEDHDIITTEEYDAGAAVSPDGDIQNVHAHEDAPSGVGEKLLIEAIERGGRTLDNYDTLLSDIYIRNGFRETARMEFDRELAGDNWDYDQFGEPDVTFMAYQPDEQYEETDNYTDDWVGAKEASREAADFDAPAPGEDTNTTTQAMSDFEPTTAQELIDDAVKRKGADYVRENFEAFVKPAKIMGYDIDREDVEIREPDA